MFTIMPIFLSESILILAFFSFMLLNDILTIRRGDILSLLFISTVNAASVSLLYDKFKFDVAPIYYIMLSSPASVTKFWHTFNPLILRCLLTYLMLESKVSSLRSHRDKSSTYLRSCFTKSSITTEGSLI
jgi:hypothetical protein